MTSDGSVYAWGAGSEGQLGDGRHEDSPKTAVKVAFPSSVTIAHLPNPMPYDTGMAVDSEGHLWVWGYDEVGEACDSPGPHYVPVEVTRLNHVLFATGAGDHATFDEGGDLVSCGGNKEDDLGDGDSAPSTTPQPVKIPASETGRIVALTSSWANAGVLYSNGDFYDWGFNTQGELGNGMTKNSDTPVRVSGDWSYVSEGGSRGDNGQTLAIDSSGAIWGWGDDQWGQLCDGGSGKVTKPKKLPISGSAVSSGGWSTYHIDKGDLYGCGDNQYGQIPSSPILTDVTQMQSTGAVASALVGNT